MIEIFLTNSISSGEYYHRDGQIFSNIGSVDINIPLHFQFCNNGATLFETKALKFISGRRIVYRNTGDFFLDNFYLKNETGFLPLYGNLSYDLATGLRFFNTGTGLFNDQLFYNGQKMTFGSNYIEGEWLDEDIGTGMLYTMGYNFNTFEVFTGKYDLYKIKFQEFNAYLNGMKVHRDDYLATASIVDCIKTGLESTVEFNTTNITWQL